MLKKVDSRLTNSDDMQVPLYTLTVKIVRSFPKKQKTITLIEFTEDEGGVILNGAPKWIWSNPKGGTLLGA